MAETKGSLQEELLKKYQAYVERVVGDLNACKKVGCYYIKEAGPGIYRIFNNGVHMDLIVGEEKALLFDTGHGFGDLHEAVRAVTDLPLYVVDSHGHLDHACGNCWFGQEVYIHPKDMELCRQHNSPQSRRDGIGMAKESAGRFPGIEMLPVDFDAESYVKMGCGNLVPVEEGHVFDLGGRTLQVVELPGHTKGFCTRRKSFCTWVMPSTVVCGCFWRSPNRFPFIGRRWRRRMESISRESSWRMTLK